MSSSRTALLLALVLLIPGCPAGGDASPARAPLGAPPAPRTYPKGAPLPGFDDVKVGEVYLFALPFRSSRTDTIKERTADELVVERAVVLAGMAQPPVALHQPLVSSGRPFLPANLELAPVYHKVAEDRLTISDRTFDCDVFETTGAGQTVRYWLASRYPFLVRSTANDSPTIELKQILDRAPEPSPGVAVPVPGAGEPKK